MVQYSQSPASIGPLRQAATDSRRPGLGRGRPAPGSSITLSEVTQNVITRTGEFCSRFLAWRVRLDQAIELGRHVADEQVATLIAAIELEPNWLEAVLGRIALRDEVERVRIQRLQVQEKLNRLGNAYLDLLITEEECKRRKRLLDLEMESLVVPQANAAEEAGRLVQGLPRLLG